MKLAKRASLPADTDRMEAMQAPVSLFQPHILRIVNSKICSVCILSSVLNRYKQRELTVCESHGGERLAALSIEVTEDHNFTYGSKNDVLDKSLLDSHKQRDSMLIIPLTAALRGELLENMLWCVM